MTTYVFAGQGSQKRRMGGALFDEFRAQTRKADKILGYSIKELCLEDPERKLGRTEFTQPAVYVVNALHYLKRQRQSTIEPDYLAGHSLGEYNALLVAGAFDFETGLRLVQKRGEVIAACGGGGMTAVLGLARDMVAGVLRDGGHTTIDIANLNSAGQIVLAGPPDDLRKCTPDLVAAGATGCIALHVSGAFHSRYMQSARDQFAAFLEDIELLDPSIPVISNVQARPYAPGELKDNLVAQIVSPVRWHESIVHLLGRGESHFEEIGHANVLTKMIRKIADETSAVQEAPPVPASRPQAAAETTGESIPATHQEAAAEPSAASATMAAAASPMVEDVAAGPTAESLGSRAFRERYEVRLAYAAGSMHFGISSVALVQRMAQARLLGFYGAAGLSLDRIDDDLAHLRSRLTDGECFGANLTAERSERELVDIYLRHRVTCVEASGYLKPTLPLVRYRLAGIARRADGSPSVPNRVLLKTPRVDIAQRFLQPPPTALVVELQRQGALTDEQVALAARVPLASDICAQAAGGGHTSRQSAAVLLPDFCQLRKQTDASVAIGLAGGIGTPAAAASAFLLGADFVLTGSVNQCTVEAGTSELAKDLLQSMGVHDTRHVPAPNFESEVQVLRKGVLFAARANKLRELYQRHAALADLDEQTVAQLEDRIFRRPLSDIAAQVDENDQRAHLRQTLGWYLEHSIELAVAGDRDRKMDFQIYCGPALGAFNRHVAGTSLGSWRTRHVDQIASLLMDGAAQRLSRGL